MALPPEADLPPQLWVLVFPGKSSGSHISHERSFMVYSVYSNFWTKPTWLFSGTCPSRSRVLDCEGAGHTCGKVTNTQDWQKNTCHESWHVLPCPYFDMSCGDLKIKWRNNTFWMILKEYQWISMKKSMNQYIHVCVQKMRWMGFPSPVSAWCSACWSWMTCALYSLPILSTVGKVASLDSFVTYRGRTGPTGISRIFHL